MYKFMKALSQESDSIIPKHFLKFSKAIFTICGLMFFSFAISAQTISKKDGIHGQIIDHITGENISRALIIASKLSENFTAVSDLNGNYFLKVVSGVYQIKVVSPSFNTIVFSNVLIKDGETLTLNASLTKRVDISKDIEVNSSIDEYKDPSAILMLKQQKSIAINETISSDFISQTPDRTTADALKRISGVAIVEDKFAIIRGLSERYNTTYINGLPLPSSESDKKSFALDLIPTQLLENISIVKSATPDMPGDFSGGLIKVNTLDVPLSNTFFANVGSELNSMTTFKNFLVSPDRGGVEDLGLLNSKRQLPDGVISTDQAKQLDPFSATDAPTISKQTSLFNNNFSPVTRMSASPNMTYQLGGSRRIELKKDVLGILGMVSYNSFNQYTPYTFNYLREIDQSNNIPPSTAQGTNYNYESYKVTTQLTGLLNLSYQLKKHTQFFFKNLLIYGSEDETIEGSGFSADGTNAYKQSDLSYLYRTNRLYSGQVGAKHTFENSKIKLECSIGYNNIQKNLPDYKRLVYSTTFDQNSNDYYPMQADVKSPATTYDPALTGRYFSTMNDNNYTVNYAVSIPIKKLNTDLKLGGLNTIRNRDFTARNYMFTYVDATTVNLNLGRDSIFLPSNMGADKLYLRETTKKGDAYTASSNLAAAFLMFETRIQNRLRLAYGIRVESYNQKLNTYNKDVEVKIDTTVVDILPSLNMIYSLTEKSNFRFSYFSSVSRPEFREMAPLSFFDINTLSVVTGNPSLIGTKIQNFDFKYEWFPAPGSMVSVNPFYKTFENPIETYNLGGNAPSYTFANFKGGYSTGMEIDFRINFKKADQWMQTNFMKDISWFFNYSLIYSSANIDKYDHSYISYIKPDYSYRPLQGQSPYVLNSGFLYSNKKLKLDISITGNRIGRRIDYVASNGRFIIWENPRTVIDFSIAKTFYKKFQARFIIANLIPQDRILYQDTDFENTVKFSNNISPFSDQHYDSSNSKNFLNYRYKYASTYSLAIGYTF